MRQIKRYANRKLYDLGEKRYITLRELAELVRNGQEITVEENETGEDITSMTLCQVIYEETRLRRSFFPPVLFREILRRRGLGLKGSIRRILGPRKGNRPLVRAIRDLVGKLVAGGTISPRASRRIQDRILRRIARTRRDALEALDRKMTEAVEQVHVPPHSDPDHLTDRLIAAIERTANRS